MGTCDIFQLSYDNVCELCRRYSRGKFKTGKNIPSSQSLHPHINPYQPCSQILSVSSYDHRNTLSDVATLPVPLHFPQYFQQIFKAGLTTQANQLHRLQTSSHKIPICPMHILVQSIPNYKNNKEVQYAYSVGLQHLPTSPTSPTLLQEIHTRPIEVVELGVIDNTK